MESGRSSESSARLARCIEPWNSLIRAWVVEPDDQGGGAGRRVCTNRYCAVIGKCLPGHPTGGRKGAVTRLAVGLADDGALRIEQMDKDREPVAGAFFGLPIQSQVQRTARRHLFRWQVVAQQPAYAAPARLAAEPAAAALS